MSFQDQSTLSPALFNQNVPCRHIHHMCADKVLAFAKQGKYFTSSSLVDFFNVKQLLVRLPVAKCCKWRQG